MNAKEKEIAKAAKKLHRAMVRYAQDHAQSRRVRFVAALQWMHDNPSIVTKDLKPLDVSEAFVVAWTKDDLRKSILR